MGVEKDYSRAFEDAGGSSDAPYSMQSAASSSGLVLHIGVIDVPYVKPPENKKVPLPQRGKRNKPIAPKVANGTQTTGDVAGWLEKKYGVMQTFADESMDQIAELLEESLSGALDNLLMGAPASANPFASAESGISQLFKDYLESGRIEQAGIEGVPTEAAKRGVNHRLKLKRGPKRPSFIDTGLYQNSAITWIE